MSYMSLWESEKVVPQEPFGRIELYFEPVKRPAGAFWGNWGGRRTLVHPTPGVNRWNVMPGGGVTWGSLPAGFSQPVDPGGVGGFTAYIIYCIYNY